MKAIERKICYKRNDTLFSHLKTYFQLDQINFSGQCDDTHFSIWRYSAFAGLFYSVVVGEIQPEKEKVNIVLKTKLNSAGLALSILVFLGFFFGFSGFEFETITVKNILLRLVFASLPLTVIFLSYQKQRKGALLDVQNIIGNIHY